MILKASQRGGGMQLARHLLNSRDNDHVEVHELRGFVSSSLEGAFKEAYAVSRGTKCTQFLFSLSPSPPETQRVPINVFETAIADIEKRIGLKGQPRAIVFHEKEGRRHAHCVWSRIDPEKMKAINLPHFKLKLRDMSRELYLEHGWQMPRGLATTRSDYTGAGPVPANGAGRRIWPIGKAFCVDASWKDRFAAHGTGADLSSGGTYAASDHQSVRDGSRMAKAASGLGLRQPARTVVLRRSIRSDSNRGAAGHVIDQSREC
ncbi:relaxase/mobilization nuclease domain-containing protein [Nitratireductor sp. OM-1]|uniref:relaxase/mobilization nuclease domain-containing protein n=1 Tax=Nitratireductor sp. OM-1 TaxID=1756988 RepID=UPI000DE14C68|nr:relaxase/mobilization nuclease domain-containing protein [Nitratireductor sp. OM-1]